MTVFKGVISKMITENVANGDIIYTIPGMEMPLNQFLEKNLSLEFIGEQCICCSKKQKIYRQGYCYKCFYKSPETGMWVMKPELSKAHLEIEEIDLEYEKKIQLQPHIVYLAKSSEIKVGVTRKSQIPTRWIDQGAISALSILEVPNRYLAGVAEVALKKYISDKTNWRKMLTNSITTNAIEEVKEKIIKFLPENVKEYLIDEDIYQLQYPVLSYPKKVTSLNIEKEKSYQGYLIGIKGQYLIFNDQKVFNVRNNTGKILNIMVQ